MPIWAPINEYDRGYSDGTDTEERGEKEGLPLEKFHYATPNSAGLTYRVKKKTISRIRNKFQK